MSWLIWAVLVIGALAFCAGLLRARVLERETGERLHSRPGYHGAMMALSAVVPALAVFVVWSLAQPVYLMDQTRSLLPAEVTSGDPSTLRFVQGQIRQVADALPLLTEEDLAAIRSGDRALPEVLADRGVAIGSSARPYLLAVAERYAALERRSFMVMIAVVYATALAGIGLAYVRISPSLRARNIVERVTMASLLLASTVAVLTTFGIVASMVSESSLFFSEVPFSNFLGTVWKPRFAGAGETAASGQFGVVPLLWGTLYISIVALIVAVPLGLNAAVYLSEYAGPRVRTYAKPLLEILAGIPSIVYGFFAIVTVGPLIQSAGEAIGLTVQANNVLTAGLVMGIMIIPFVSSLSDDIINAVPQSLRDGSLALGATPAETVSRVVLPAALPGIVGAVLLAASRAIGETMIVVLAAGTVAQISLNPLEPMTTMTVKIVSQLTGDQDFTSPQTLVAYALGITLFSITLVLNIIALQIVRRYREQYE